MICFSVIQNDDKIWNPEKPAGSRPNAVRMVEGMHKNFPHPVSTMGTPLLSFIPKSRANMLE